MWKEFFEGTVEVACPTRSDTLAFWKALDVAIDEYKPECKLVDSRVKMGNISFICVNGDSEEAYPEVVWLYGQHWATDCGKTEINVMCEDFLLEAGDTTDDLVSSPIRLDMSYLF